MIEKEFPTNNKTEQDIIPGFHQQNQYWVSPIDKSNMIFVPEGAFFMGNQNIGSYKDEAPVHEVTISAFLVDNCKVSCECYQKFLTTITAGDGSFSSEWDHAQQPKDKSHVPNFWEKQLEFPKQAVVGIDWYDTWAYANWANKSLLTEAQWEKICKQQQQLLPYDDYVSPQQDTYINDLLGQGWEWCMDTYNADYYIDSPTSNPCYLEDGLYKLVRGGIYNSVLPLIRSTFRNYYPPLHREDNLGFRCSKQVELLPAAAEDGC